ncbi:hypothetical protein ABZV93_11090 [Actinopolymorpha sp. NPDC004070]
MKAPAQRFFVPEAGYLESGFRDSRHLVWDRYQLVIDSVGGEFGVDYH